MTEIQIKTDVFQTWQFDFIYKKSFVERKHVTDDVAGNYTLAEPVATGEYKMNDFDRTYQIDDFVYVIQVSELLPPYDSIFLVSCNYGGIPMAGSCFIVRTFAEFKQIIRDYNTAQKIEAIMNCYIVPEVFVDMTNFSQVNPNVWLGQDTPLGFTFNVNKPTNLDNYTPRNQKLLTYPYCYLVVSNNAGSENILHYEKFGTSDCEFGIKGIPSVGCSAKCRPNYYGNQIYNEEEGVLLGKYPSLNWNKDSYNTWLLTNSATLSTQKSIGAASVVGGSVLTGIGLAMIISSFMTAGASLAPRLSNFICRTWYFFWWLYSGRKCNYN